MSTESSAGAQKHAAGVRICASSDLVDGGLAVTFEAPLAAGPSPALVVRWRGAVYGYVNRCAHAAVPLDWKGRVLDLRIIGEHEYLFDLDADERERANLARREPHRPVQMGKRWEQCDARMLSVPSVACLEKVFIDACSLSAVAGISGGDGIQRLI